ncbi:MAG: hypothetical protein ACE5PV_22505 [Candidatus Poribacteria bacterium]
MKAKLYDKIELLVDIKSEFRNKTIKKGTRGVIVECYSKPIEGYAVDLSIPNEDLVGGYEYENVILFPHQFVLDGSSELGHPECSSSDIKVAN